MYSFPPLKTHVHMCFCTCTHMHMLISLHACIAATFILVFLKSMWTNLSSWGRRVYALNTSTWETNLYEFEASFVYMLSYRSPKLHSETVSKKNKRSVCPQVAIAFSHHPSCISIINSAFVVTSGEVQKTWPTPKLSSPALTQAVSVSPDDSHPGLFTTSLREQAHPAFWWTLSCITT